MWTDHWGSINYILKKKKKKKKTFPLVAVSCQKMALSKNLKRKVNSENRIFHDERTENYAFILLSFINAKLTCLICNYDVSACKEYNIRRHHETKHANFKVAFLKKTEARKPKIEALKGAYAHSNRILVRGLTSQQKVTSASLKASWVLAKCNKPFT